MQSEINDKLIGSTLDGRFIVESLLGRGGMGSVYRAHHIQLERKVALKILSSNVLTDAISRERFLREIKAASSLDHPNIVRTLHSALAADGSAFVVMELLEGTSLAKVLDDEKKLPIDRAMQILRNVASALAYAHTQGIMHRDIKPSNVMLVPDGGPERAMLIDFGLAKEVAPATQSQTNTTMQGSPLYMSPEQCQQQRTDVRTDIYSFGCLMHAVLNGAPPFEADSAYGVLFQHIHEQAPSLKDVPAYLQNIAAKCLEKNPERRFSDATDLLTALNKADINEVVTPQKRKQKLAVKRIIAACAAIAMIPPAVLYFNWDNILDNENAVSQLGSLLRNAHLYSGEQKLFEAAAERILSAGPLPMPGVKSAGALPVSEQRRIPLYTRYRINATQARVNADPANAMRAVAETSQWFENEFIAHVDNVYIDQKIYDEAVGESTRLPLMLPEGTLRRDVQLFRRLHQIPLRASVRASQRATELLRPAIDSYESALRLVDSGDHPEIVAAYHWLFRDYFRLALETKDPVAKARLLQRAKYLNEQEHVQRLADHEDLIHIGYCDTFRALFPLLGGDEKTAATLLDDALVEFTTPCNIDESNNGVRLILLAHAERLFGMINRVEFLQAHMRKFPTLVKPKSCLDLIAPESKSMREGIVSD